jgi:hypothetical protein
MWIVFGLDPFRDSEGIDLTGKKLWNPLLLMPSGLLNGDAILFTRKLSACLCLVLRAVGVHNSLQGERSISERFRIWHGAGSRMGCRSLKQRYGLWGLAPKLFPLRPVNIWFVNTYLSLTPRRRSPRSPASQTSPQAIRI